jgi:hypothetical protein
VSDWAYTKKQLDEMEKNMWTQEKIEEAEWKIMEDKDKIKYLDNVIAEKEKNLVRQNIHKEIKKELRKEIREEEKKKKEEVVFIPPDSTKD